MIYLTFIIKRKVQGSYSMAAKYDKWQMFNILYIYIHELYSIEYKVI